MSQKQSAEFSDSFGWKGWTTVPEDSGQPNHAARSLNFSAKSLRNLGVRLRLGWRAFAFFLDATFIFIFATCCVAVFLVESHCGSDLGYYGCEIDEHWRPSRAVRSDLWKRQLPRRTDKGHDSGYFSERAHGPSGYEHVARCKSIRTLYRSRAWIR